MFRKSEMEMTQGPLLKKLMVFSLPLMMTGILQLLYNAADIIVVGRFSGEKALAAVGATGSLTNLLINLFIGLSIGANVVVARNLGAKDEDRVHRAVHTSMLLSIIGGLFVGGVGILFSEPLLLLMGTPEDVVGLSVLYMRIYFIGMPASMVYNFGASILRAKGDTKRPLWFLMVSGLVNVGLNLLFVVKFEMSVDGVAYATVISQYLSVAMILISLTRLEDSCKLSLKKLKLYGNELKNIMRIGFPAGVQSSLFSVSNVLIQWAVNSFGSVVVAGYTAASNVENFIYISMNSVSQAAITFTSQNFGARQSARITKILWQCVAIVTFLGVALGTFATVFPGALIGFYTTSQEVIAVGSLRLSMVAISYFLCGIMEVFAGVMRGMNYSLMPMIVSLLGACGFRILWIFTVFALERNIIILYLSYPLSWILTDITHYVCYVIVKKRVNLRLS